ncbi:MAG: 3-deoxy-7-phosphoheptulonate synthase [Fimbriimonadaceae bacterium]
MIVVFKNEVERDQIDLIVAELQSEGFSTSIVQTGERLLIDAVGVPSHLASGVSRRLRANPLVADVVLSGSPFKLIAGTSTKPVKVGRIAIGGPDLVIMAGPCTVESPEQIESCAKAVGKAGATFLRGGAYKPSTSPYGFQGLGTEALRWLRDSATANGLMVITEVMDPRRVDEVSQYADILQLGSRNMQNFDLLKEVGRTKMPVLLKRGLAAKLSEWLLAAEYIANEGNENIIMCERGIRGFDDYTRNVLDLAVVPAIKGLTHLPVIVDPSHAAGRRDLIAPLSAAAIAAGADGLLIEVHPNPPMAKKDGGQSLSFEEFDQTMAGVSRIAGAIGRPIKSLVGHP